jgi:hypothetical protein
VMNMKKPIVIAITTLLLALCVWVAILLRSNIPETPELALQAFYVREVAEDQIMDPLILAGPEVIPLLERDLANPEMQNKRYAIGALGNLKSEAALGGCVGQYAHRGINSCRHRLQGLGRF